MSFINIKDKNKEGQTLYKITYKNNKFKESIL